MKKFFYQENIIDFFFSLIFSFGQIIGYNCYKYDNSYINNSKTYLLVLLLTFIIFIFIYGCKKIKTKNVKLHNFLANNKYQTLVFLFLIIIAWLPVLIGLYPGNFSYDAGTQMRMFNDLTELSKYHPVLHTLFLGLTIKLGQILFNSYTTGVFIHSLVQMIIMAYIFAYTLTFVSKRVYNRFLNILFLLFYMFLPTFSVLAITTTKDILFTGIFNLVIICYIEIIENNDILKNKKFIIKLIVLSFLLIALRNNMLYAYLVFMPICLLIIKRYFKSLLIIFVVTLLLFISYDKILTYGFHIEDGPKIETFSFAVQQFARVYHKNNLSYTDKELITKLYTNDSLQYYNSHISDPIKSNFNSEELLNNKQTYLKLYLKLLIKYPKTFIDSLLINTYGYYYVLDTMPDSGSRTYIEIDCLAIENGVVVRSNNCHKNVSILYDFYNNLLENGTYSHNIILQIIFNIGTYFWLFIYFLWYLLFNKKMLQLLPMLLVLAYILTSFLAPVAILRYVFILYTGLPLYIYLYRSAKIKKRWKHD